MAKWQKLRRPKPECSAKTLRAKPADGLIPAAQYVRRSTDYQKYSTQYQMDAIGLYAAANNMLVVRTYADEGRSGLTIDSRDGLKQLIGDVQKGHVPFEVVLVYDVSRWGRFQDADESAHYEFICKQAGITVRYCAEQFENDGGLSATLIKTLKRAMAAEYSRELSAKVFAAQSRLVHLGFKHGGSPGYGLRRELIDEHRNSKGFLRPREYKNIQRDRVILRPGPPEEIAIIRRIFTAYVVERKSEKAIVEMLNAEGLPNQRGGPWTRIVIHRILTSEKYIGNNVYNQTSARLKQKKVFNPPDKWIRANNVFEAVVDRDLFARAQKRMSERTQALSNEQMLEKLTALFRKKGRLSYRAISNTPGMPNAASYRHRFGSLRKAYALIGYDLGHRHDYVDINLALRTIFHDLVGKIIEAVEKVGGQVDIDEAANLLIINGDFRAAVMTARCVHTREGHPRWAPRVDKRQNPDIIIIARMSKDNRSVLDYFILPRLNIEILGDTITLADKNGVYLQNYRFQNLDALRYLCARINIDVDERARAWADYVLKWVRSGLPVAPATNTIRK